MASDASADKLAKQFKELPLVDKYPNCFPDINPFDIYRSHITSLLHNITGVEPKVIYGALQWTATLDKGDLVLAIPALRVKGKPDALGKEWMDKVGR
jgi:arginyl-tRNA synthetase